MSKTYVLFIMKISEIWGKRDMKKSLYFAFFVNFVFLIPVFSENVNWYVGDNLYTTTTCEIGNDISLPVAPTKTGYVFWGWREKTNRGTFNTWNDVLTQQTPLYNADLSNNRIPMNGDYIIVTDASDYPGTPNVEILFQWTDPYHSTIAINNFQEVMDHNNPTDYGYIRVVPGWTWVVYAQTDVIFNGVVYRPGSEITRWTRTNDYGIKVMYAAPGNVNLSGTWRYVYDGDWDIDNVAGWKPVAQIE